MDGFLEARSQSGLLTGIPSCFRIDGLIAAMVAVARKEPGVGFWSQAVPMCTKFLEQLRAEHHIAISAPLAALNVNYHALAVDVADFQVCQLGVAHSGGVERDQQSAMQARASRIDESCDFFLAQDRREGEILFSDRESRRCSRPS